MLKKTICFLIVLTLVFGLIACVDPVDPYEPELEENPEAKGPFIVHEDIDFADDSVVIVLFDKYSQYHGIDNDLMKKLKALGAKKVTSLTDLSEEHINKDGTINIEAAPHLANLVGKEWHQILLMKIEPGKQNVIDTIKKLENVKEVMSAEPDYIFGAKYDI